MKTTLWFGDSGTTLDEYSNVYSVSKAPPANKLVEPQLLAIYQDILRELGCTVEVERIETIDPNEYVVRHIIKNNRTGYSKIIGYKEKRIGNIFDNTYKGENT